VPNRLDIRGVVVQRVGNADRRRPAVEGAIRRLLLAGARQRPTAFLSSAGDLDVLVSANADVLIDRLDLGIQHLTERCQASVQHSFQASGLTCPDVA
jgi:hypothetical protein